MKMKCKFYIATIFLIVLIGCMPSPKPTEAQPTNIQPSTVVSTPTINNVDINISPTTAPEVTRSPVNWGASKSCVEIYPTRPDNYQLAGIVPIRSLSSSMLGLSMSLLNLENGNSTEIDTENQSVWDAHVSTNRKLLAYTWFNTVTSKWELTLIDALGNHQKVAWSSDDTFGFTGWLNDHQLIIPYVSSYMIVDPYNSSSEEIFPLNFPDFVIYDQTRFYVSFDPLLTRAVYKNNDVALLDLDTKTIITKINDGYDRIPIVAWQSSGKRLAAVGTIQTEESFGLSDEIFIAERNGEFRQLTNLHESFGQVFTVDSLSWSPNEDIIAFWLYEGQGKQTLMVANALTGDVTNYCILNVTSDLFPIYIPAPIWSPNGKQLLVENRYAKAKSNLLVVDLLKKIAFPIAENANPVGWMATP